MRILVVVSHYFKRDPEDDLHRGLGSGRAPFAKIAALNAQMVALHRYFGPLRASLDSGDPQAQSNGRDNVDIVVVTAKDANLLEFVAVTEPAYAIEYFDGPPMMLGFEAQRIMRERAGAYDFYAFMEDDLILDDPAFFAKIAWFEENFGDKVLLQPIRYEMSNSGTLAKVAIEPPLSRDNIAPFRRAELQSTLTATWNGGAQTFYLPRNPHAGCFVLTTQQLTHWMSQPSFYDRDISWVGPLESAATFAPGRAFGLYKALEPDPWFLAIEHYGTRYASTLATERVLYGEAPLLALLEATALSGPNEALSRMIDQGAFARTMNGLVGENQTLRRRLNSRSGLAKGLMKALWSKSALK